MLKHRINQTDSLYQSLSSILASTTHDGEPRSLVSAALGGITLEHGYSIRALVDLGQLTSAITLLRAQFESVTRALWVHYAASDAWVTTIDGLLKSGSLEESSGPGMDDMLAATSKTAPESVGRMLKGLKDGAWKPLNSYVHSGVHPITQHHRGYPSEYALQTLRNANGLATTAVMLMGVMSGDPAITAAVRRAQLDHLDCLPPLAR